MTKPAHFRRWLRLRIYLIPCMIAAAVCMPSLFGEKWVSDTGLYTAVSLKAAREGHWWTLWLSDKPYFNKPPLPFWVHASVLKVFGVHDWSIRLPEYLAVIGCVLLTVRLARMWSARRVAMLAGVILACTPQFVLLVDSFRLDYLHTLWLMAAVVMVAKGVKRFDLGRSGAPWWIAASGLAVGCALMTKPLWGLVVYAVLAVWLMMAGGRRVRLVPWLVVGACVAGAVALPWHVSMVRLHGEAFTGTYFGRQIADRMEGKMGPQAGWHWYFTFLSQTYWPWLPFVVLAAVWSVIGRPRLTRDVAGVRLAWVWVLVMLVMVSAFPGKNRYYIYHLYPMLAWLAAMSFGQVIRPAWRRVMDYAVLLPAAAGLVVAIAVNVPRETWNTITAADALSRPEPSTVAMCAAVLVCLALWRWYRVIERRAIGVIAAVVLIGVAVVVPVRERRAYVLPKPWPQLHEWVREEVASGRVDPSRLYNGSVKYNMNARIYVMESVWPIVSGWNNSPTPEPDVSEGPAWLIFDVQNDQQRNRPREDDERVFRAGQIVVVKRVSGGGGGEAQENTPRSGVDER